MSELPTENLHEYAPLSEIASLIGDVSYKQLNAWANRGTNNFPECVSLGKYKLYKKEEVITWVTLWRKVNGTLGRRHLQSRER